MLKPFRSNDFRFKRIYNVKDYILSVVKKTCDILGEYTSRLLSESREVENFERVVIIGPYEVLYF